MKKQHLVLVEDSPEIMELIGILLDNAPYTLTMYGTASGLRKHLETRIPDILVMDIFLPDGNGIELCRELKQSPRTGHIPIILMSANAYDHTQDDCADAFIAKPFDIHAFKNTIESYLPVL